MAKECITHHNACDCREEKFKQLDSMIEKYKKLLDTYKKRTEINQRLIVELHDENKIMKEFIQDCSVSHIESRYKYKAKTMLLKMDKQ